MTTTDIATTLHGIIQTASDVKDRPETCDTDALWKLLDAITEAKKVVGDELVRRMLAAAKEA